MALALLLGLLSLLVPLAVLGGGVYLVVRLAQRGLGSGVGGSRGLLRAYLRFAYLASLIVFLVGTTSLLSAAFGLFFGHDFSYLGPLIGQDNRQADDVVRGISLTLAGGLLAAAHLFGARALETEEERFNSVLARIETLVLTGGFGLVTIISLPLAVYVLVRYVVLGPPAPPSESDAPGPALAVAISFGTVWAYYLAELIRRARSAKETSPAA